MLPIYDGPAVSEAPGGAPGKSGDHPLKGKRIYIPPMAYGSARAFASAFRAIGLEAEPTPPSDNRTRELGARYTSGDECYPAKVTVGDFMKVVENPADRQEADRAVHADGAGSVPLRAIRAVPAADSGCQRVRRSRDTFSHQPERVRRPGHAGRGVRTHGLARAAGGGPVAEAAADVAPVRRAARRQRADV